MFSFLVTKLSCFDDFPEDCKGHVEHVGFRHVKYVLGIQVIQSCFLISLRII